MKYLLLKFLYFGLLSFSIAQPTITSDWFLKPGEQTIIAGFHPNSSMEPNEGLNVLWDISQAPIPKFELKRQWLSPSNMKYRNEFPEATLGYLNTRGTETYYQKTNSSLIKLGSISERARSSFVDERPIINIGDFSYGDTLTYSYIIAVEKEDKPIIYSKEITETIIYAGYGTVVTPLDRYDDCILIKRLRTSDEPIDHNIKYSFYKDNFSNLIAEYRHSPMNVEPPRTISYRIDRLTKK